ncbi:MAG: hypothetical protein RLY31_1939 [Bacteroidota bacterium]|jgi:hypothetical protein
MKRKTHLVWLPLFLLAVACSDDYVGRDGKGNQAARMENFNKLSTEALRDKVVLQVFQFVEKRGIDLDEDQQSGVRRLVEAMDWSGDRNRASLKARRDQLVERVRQEILTEAQREKFKDIRR